MSRRGDYNATELAAAADQPAGSTNPDGIRYAQEPLIDGSMTMLDSHGLRGFMPRSDRLGTHAGGVYRGKRTAPTAPPSKAFAYLNLGL